MSYLTPPAPPTTPVLTVTAIYYSVKGQTIPARSTLLQRDIFARGAGFPPMQAAVIAMQDRGSSLANTLGSLVAQSGNPALIAKAEALVTRWNDECEEFFRSR